MNNIFKAISEFFKRIFSSPGFRDFIKAVFTAEKAVILALLKDISIKAVSELGSMDTLTNDQKRKKAFAAISDYATIKGIQASNSMINLAIEMAYQAYQEGKRQ